MIEEGWKKDQQGGQKVPGFERRAMGDGRFWATGDVGRWTIPETF